MEPKKELFEKVIDYFSNQRKNRDKFINNPDDVRDLMKLGAEKARDIASKTLLKVKKAAGLIQMFEIKLENFNGPLDLLLYFIKRDKIDIYDIPITQITDEYIQVIDKAKKLDISIAGEFLFMASMLLRIKTQMILPRKIDEEGFEIDDPRIDLVAQLIEYKKFKRGSIQM